MNNKQRNTNSITSIQHNASLRPAPIRAFTLVELLVVTAILVILLAASVPAFTVLVRNSERSLAEIRVTTGLRAARDAALAQGPGRDTAAVFFFDYEAGNVGRVSIVPCVRVGSVDDEDNQGRPIRRDVFVPIPELEPAQLPAGAAVRAFAPPGMIRNNSPWMNHAFDRYNDDRGNWVFPESDFVNTQEENDGPRRHTFMVRFAGGTGNIIQNSINPSIVVSPAATTSADWRQQAPFTAAPILPNTDNLERWAASILATPRFSLPQQRRLVGEESPDTVLAMPVSVLAVYDERELASALGVRTDRGTRTVLQTDNDGYAEFIDGNVNAARINNWIWGDSDLSGAVRGSDNPAATLLTFDRYTGLAIQAGIAIDGQEGT